MRRQLLVVAVAGWLVAADKPSEVKNDTAKLQGTWKATAAEFGGKSDKDGHNIELVIKGNKFTVNRDGKAIVQGTFQIDPKKSPPTIDFKISAGEGQGKTAQGIYRLDKGQLHWCSAKPGVDQRPRTFATKETEFMLVTFRRATD